MSQKIRQNTKILKKLVIAIDGPAASGKSTTSKLAARRLGYLFVDTGAMYRAMTLKVLEHGIGLHDVDGITSLAKQTTIRLQQVASELTVFLDDRDVTELIRQQNVTRAVSAISAVKGVRELMVREQRKMGEQGGIILEGRDIGTVVFPGAAVKIYLVADPWERARRRLVQTLKRAPTDDEIAEETDRLVHSDAKDAKQSAQAPDAVLLDTTYLTQEEQVDRIVALANAVTHRGGALG